MSAYSDLILADGASHYWRLNEVSGLIAADVASGSTCDIFGGVTLNQPGAISDGASMLLNGVDGHLVTAPNAVPVAIPVVTTLEAWVRTSAVTLQPIISPRGLALAADPQFTGDAVFFGLDAGKMLIYLTGPANGTRVVADGQWHHVVAVLNGTTCSLYVDGVFDVTAPFTRLVPYADGKTALGSDTATSSRLNGSLDEVAIYPLALTPAQIAAHYEARTPTVADVALRVGRLVSVRSLVNGTWRLQTGRVTAVSGDTVTCVVDRHGAVGTTYTNLPRWSRAAPATAGWLRS